jgi:hypothetical protein
MSELNKEIKNEILKKLNNDTFFRVIRYKTYKNISIKREEAVRKLQRFIRKKKENRLLKFKLIRMIYTVVLNFHEEVRKPTNKIIRFLRIIDSESIAYGNPSVTLCSMAGELNIRLIAIVLIRPKKNNKTIGFLYEKNNDKQRIDKNNAIYI